MGVIYNSAETSRQRNHFLPVSRVSDGYLALIRALSWSTLELPKAYPESTARLCASIRYF